MKLLNQKLDVQIFMIFTIFLFKNSADGNAIQKIIGGQSATLGQYPAQVSIQFGILGHYCGGTLVTLSDVVTAAHCTAYGLTILKTYVKVIAGDIRNEYRNGSSMQELSIRAVVSHPLYDCKTLENDIAVIKLVDQFNETEYLAPMHVTDKKPSRGETCEIVGWGSVDPNPMGDVPEILQRADVEILEPDICGSRYDPMPYIDESMICAGALMKRGVCSGDSGGPLICHNKLAGVISAGQLPCIRGGNAGRFTDVEYFRRFVQTMVEWTGVGAPPLRKLFTFQNSSGVTVLRRTLVITLFILLVCT